MDRREFLKSVGAAAAAAGLPGGVWAQAGGRYERLLVLIELKGGNDGLNTVVPYADPEYSSLRPRLALARDQVLQLDDRTGLHSSLEPLLDLWQERELAIVQGVGYPNANLSHFRSIEIWDTASGSGDYLASGWLARTFATSPPPTTYAADGVVVGASEMGPFAGGGTRAVAIANVEQFLRRAELAAGPVAQPRNAALAHIMKVEQDIMQAAAGLDGGRAFRTAFPQGAFGNAVKTAAQVIAARAGVAAVRLTLNGFDTHSNQLPTQARLLKVLADGLVALKGVLVELGRWDSTLVMTYAEFGRRPRQNQSGGTDHGTASAHFVAGGRVKGGLYGAPPALNRLDGNGNLPFAVDFRELYATVLERWWGMRSTAALSGRFAPLDLLRA